MLQFIKWTHFDVKMMKSPSLTKPIGCNVICQVTELYESVMFYSTDHLCYIYNIVEDSYLGSNYCPIDKGYYYP
jgi:hypothetical protein